MSNTEKKLCLYFSEESAEKGALSGVPFTRTGGFELVELRDGRRVCITHMFIADQSFSHGTMKAVVEERPKVLARFFDIKTKQYLENQNFSDIAIASLVSRKEGEFSEIDDVINVA